MKEKRIYEVPEVELLEFAVEAGFAGSPQDGGFSEVFPED